MSKKDKDKGKDAAAPDASDAKKGGDKEKLKMPEDKEKETKEASKADAKSSKASKDAKASSPPKVDPKLSLSLDDESDSEDTDRSAGGRGQGLSKEEATLFKAAFQGDKATLQSALEGSKLPELASKTEPEFGSTLLHHAAAGGRDECVGLLLDKGASIVKGDKDGYNPVHYAAMYGKASSIDAMASRKGKAMEALGGPMDGVPKATPLGLAIYFNRRAAFRALVTAGADITVLDDENRSLVHLAVLERRKKYLVELVNQKKFSDLVNLIDKDGNTALHLALQRGYVQLAEILILSGADVNVADSDGATPLIIATQENLFPAVKALLAKGAKPLATDKKGKQALDYASELGFQDIQYYLVNSGGDVSVLYNGKNKQGLLAPPDETVDKYLFYVNQPLYKTLIVEPNPEKEEDPDPKQAKKIAKILAKPAKKLLKDKKMLKTLRKAIMEGQLTNANRTALWRKILNDRMGDKKKSDAEYRDYLSKSMEMKHIIQIDKDIERCLRIHKTLAIRYGPGQQELFHLLRAYAAYDTETRYTQGMSTLATLLILVYQPKAGEEADVFSAFIALFEHWKLRDWYKNDLLGLREEVFVIFPAMLRKYLKKTAAHLEELMIQPSFFLTQWALELFFTHMPFELLMRFLDLFLLEGPRLFYSMSLALLQLNEDGLLGAEDMEGINNIVKGNPADGLEMETILKAALNKKYQWKDKDLAKLLAAGKAAMEAGM